jgi:hypothetical protein
MQTIKHIGRMKNTGAKVVVAFRTLPGDSNSALVIGVSSITDAYHDSLMQLLESEQGQQTNEFGEIMHIRHFPDGRPMLVAMQQDGRLQKVATDMVIMTPTHNSNIALSELNLLIAEQKNIPVDELASLVSGAKPTEPIRKENNAEPVATHTAQKTNQPLTDKDLARSYRSQADAMYKEAARLRREADELDPPTKKAISKKEEVVSGA